jgi:type I restriction enzyme S subunit
VSLPRTPFGSVCHLVNGKAFKPTDWSDAGVPIIRIQNLNDSDKPFNHWAGSLDKQVLVKAGDLLLAWSGTPGTSFGAHLWNGPNGILNQHIFRCDLDHKAITKEWARIAVNHRVHRLIEQAHGGVGLQHVTRGMVEQLEIPLPPLAEQRRIAEVLGRAEALRAKRRAALAQLDTLTQSIFLDLFGDPATNPKDWPVRPIGDLLESASYGTSEKAGPTGEFPVLRMNNITRTGELDFTDLKFMDLAASLHDRYLVRAGDVLFNRTNSADLVGKTGIYRESKPMAYAGYLIRLRVTRENDPEFLAGFLNSGYSKRMLRGMCKSIIGMANINATEIQTMRIPQPPLQLQREFARRVTAVEKLKAMQRASLGELDTLFASLQHRAFRGEL